MGMGEERMAAEGVGVTEEVGVAGGVGMAGGMGVAVGAMGVEGERVEWGGVEVVVASEGVVRGELKSEGEIVGGEAVAVEEVKECET